jgi:lipid A 3-O-deacylase
MNKAVFNFLIASVFFFAGAITASAQSYRNQIGLQSDNDAYLTQGSDRYYTNGFFLYYRHALELKDNAALQNKVLGIEAGQKIFNAQSGNIPSAIYVDRPIAGYLYAGATLNLLYKNESNFKLGAQLGIVGPGSLANQAQNFIHDTFGLYPIKGWAYQVKNAAQFNLSAEYNKLLVRASWIDLTASAYANAGTGFTGAGVGPLIRLGNFNQLFNSEITQSTVSVKAIRKLHDHEFFFYYKPMFNAVAYDATIQGGLGATHNDPNEVIGKIKPLIFSQEFGVTYSGSRWTFNLAALTRGKESQKMLAPHQWGSVKILYLFN